MYLLSFACFVGLVLLCECRLDEEVAVEATEKPAGKQCFHLPPEACPEPSNPCRCKTINITTAVCCNVTPFLLKEGLACASIKNGQLRYLHVRNLTSDVLNMTNAAWRQLESLAITDGSVGQVVGELPKFSTISCFNLSSNSINKFEERLLVNLYNIGIVDLSHNNLTDLPRFRKEVNITLDVSGNEYLLCSHLFDAMKRTDLHFKNDEDTACLSSQTFHWFNSTELVPLKQVLSVHELRKECSSNCSCEPYSLEIVPGKPPTFAVLVNCSGLELTSLPAELPPNTIALNISNNNISSLDIMSKEVYQSLRELYADNNEITSILPLEGTKFIANLMVLSLRNNKLKSLPTYILSNIFDRNYNFQYVNLGLNKLHCDCNTAKVLKEWLLAKHKQIPDYDEIYCENMKSRVIDLDSSQLCQSQQDWTDYIYYIITAEVLLLVCLIAKVSYDYWVFKTAGYLPWPASQMPKLPCDWLCE